LNKFCHKLYYQQHIHIDQPATHYNVLRFTSQSGQLFTISNIVRFSECMYPDNNGRESNTNFPLFVFAFYLFIFHQRPTVFSESLHRNDIRRLKKRKLCSQTAQTTTGTLARCVIAFMFPDQNYMRSAVMHRQLLQHIGYACNLNKIRQACIHGTQDTRGRTIRLYPWRQPGELPLLLLVCFKMSNFTTR